MEHSQLIAQIVSIVYLSYAVGFACNSAYYQKAIAAMMKDSSWLIIGGLMAIIIGMFIIATHNVWTNDWTVLITIIGWIGLIKGVTLIAFPQSFRPFEKIFDSRSTMIGASIVTLVLGLVFGYFGFFAA